LNPKFHPLIEHYKTTLLVEKRHSPHTVTSYLSDVNQFLALQSIKKPNELGTIGRQQCREFLKYLDEGKYQPKSVARKISSLRMFWTFLIRYKGLSKNPWEFLSLPKLPKKLPIVLFKKEASQFLNQIKTTTPQGVRDKAICELIYSSGLRVSEVTALNVSDIDLTHFEIRVLGKGRKERIALFSAVARDAIQTYLDEVRPVFLDKDNRSAIFLNVKGGRLTTRSIQRIFKEISKAQALKSPVTPHTLRHSFASTLYNEGADLRSVQELLGHSSLSSTQIYTHLAPGKLLKTFKKSHPRA
jgi:integrase/recombinase XerC